MGGSPPSTTTQIQKVELPKWVEDASQNNYQFAQQIAAKPLVQYGGQTVADVSPQQQQAQDLIAGGVNTGQPAYDAASGAYTGVLGKGAPQVTAGQLAGTDLSPYMNPYTDDVINRTMADMNTQRLQALGSNADKAVAAKAFGGSRSAIVDALTNSEANKNAGDMASTLRMQGFTNAQQQATGDINRTFQGALANQGADTAKMQADLAAGQGLQGLGDSEVKSLVQKYMGLSDAGTKERGQQQQELDATKALFDQKNDYDLTKLNILLSSLGMSPYGKTQTTTTTGQSGGNDWAQAGLGVLSIFGGLFGGSDKELKTDIKRVGKDKSTGLDMYSYRYKGDPKTYPKVVGPMAQDIAKKIPGAVKRIGGKLAVDNRVLAATGAFDTKPKKAKIKSGGFPAFSLNLGMGKGALANG